MTQRQVVLTDEMDAFVTSMVEGGDYADANDVMQTALATLQREGDAKFNILKAAIDEGFASGTADGDLHEVFARVRERAGLPPRTR